MTAGPKPNRFVVTERFLEVFDGLMLGDGGLSLYGTARTPTFRMSQSVKHMEWVRMVADELSRAGLEVRVEPLKAGPGGRGPAVQLFTLAYEELIAQHVRWYQLHPSLERTWLKIVPKDVRLTPVALAHWFSGDGTRGSNGYSVRFCTHGFVRADVELLAAKLKELHGWEPEVFPDRKYWIIRLSRSGDRLGLRRLIAGLVPRCFAHKLQLRESKPCSPEEAARRRRPRHLTEELAAEARRRIAAGELYATIALDLGVNERSVGKLARGESHRDSGVSIVRRRAMAKRLTAADERKAFELAEKGESQYAIARALGTNQPRICRLLARKRP